MAEEDSNSLFDDDELLNNTDSDSDSDMEDEELEEENDTEEDTSPVGEQRQLTSDDYPWLDVCTAKETEIGNAVQNISELAPNLDRNWVESAKAHFAKGFSDLRNAIVQPVDQNPGQ